MSDAVAEGSGSPPGVAPTLGAAAEPADPGARAACRARLLAQFEVWLDETLADEPLPPGLDESVVAAFLAPADLPARTDPPAGCSLYDLWAAMTALTQEVKIQGRTFRQLTQTVEPIAGLDQTVHAALAAQDQALTAATRLADGLNTLRNERQREAIRDAERRASKGAIEALMDVRDRLKRGLATAQTAATLRLGRWSALVAPGARRAVEATTALRQGYEMALARLDECLLEQGIREIAAAGAAFDPQRMRAAEAVGSAAVPDGTVLEVLRCGYESDTEVVRVAEVRVARQQ